MNNDERRRTFLRLSTNQETGLIIKKKTVGTIKLPSMRQTAQEIVNYVLGEIIGEGGFAKVRLCTRTKDGEQFVIKIFQKFRLITEDKKKAVLHEIDIMKCIKHPSIIKIIDYFQTSDTFNIVMEHFSLTSLAHFAKQNRPISDSTLRSIVKQISEAVLYLHKMKIAHRDLKPQNILINQYEEIKLIDLGLSMKGDQTEVKVAGTPYYMSPELIHKKYYDPFKADIWAFGILLYWLTLGYFPQNNESPKKKKSTKIFQLHFPSDMHPGIEYLITKMLHEEPSERVSAEQILLDTWVQPKDFKSQISKLMKNLAK